MARMREVPHVLRSIGVFTFIKRVWHQLGDDAVFTWASALAYSWLFAIFPFLIFMLSLVPLMPERFKDTVRMQVPDLINRTVPSEAAAKIILTEADKLLEADNQSEKTAFKTLLSFGLLLTIWGASGGMAMTMSALDKAYDIEKSRRYVKHRLVAIMITIIVATMVIFVMILMPLGTATINWLVRHAADLHIPIRTWALVLVNIVRYAIALMLLFAITATIYHFGPNLKQRFRIVTPGAVFSITVWLILGALFRLYIGKFGGEQTYSKTYGTVAGLVILLLFFYIDALVLLIGAEINSEIDFAVAGIASGKDVEERVVAPLPTPENIELAQELQEKRKEAEREITPLPPDAAR
ncbi:MAG: YihY/virulence factor BrkB family protein [Anaerolineae bacterium]|nr:YihY/virulence factor BrkB family protein [Phycisphaerae bacterium]